MRILLIEDDDAIAEPLASGLRRQGFVVTRAATGAEGLAASSSDVVLLDLGLPDIDGTEVCRRLRAASDIPIIVVTARSEEIDRVIGLELGADDYIVKPFGFRELVARIRAVSRRSRAGREERRSGPVRLNGLEIDTRTHRVRLEGNTVPLTPKEFDVLALLAEDPGAVVTRERFIDEVWDTNWYGSTKTLDVHIGSLRRKLRDPTLIETVRGIGFRLAVTS